MYRHLVTTIHKGFNFFRYRTLVLTFITIVEMAYQASTILKHAIYINIVFNTWNLTKSLINRIKHFNNEPFMTWKVSI